MRRATSYELPERTRSGNRATRLRQLTDFLAVASTDLVLWRLTTNQLDHMKIIFQGSIPKPPANWWTLLPMICGNCKTKVQLEDEDKPIFGAERRPNGKRWVEIPCPTCGAAIQHDEVAMRGASPENDRAVTPATEQDHGK
jgi:hypothetical protein